MAGDEDQGALAGHEGSSVSPAPGDATTSPAPRIVSKPASSGDKPWYLDPPKVAGVLGFVLALGTLGERLWVREQEQTQQRLVQLSEVVSSLADIQVEYLEALGKAPSNIYALGVAKNTKRQMHLQTAAALLSYQRVKARASAQILAALGGEYMSDGRYDEAAGNLLAALKAPGADDTTKPSLLRALGILHRVPETRVTNLPAARDYFKRARDMQDARRDETGHLSWAETMLTEASYDVTYGDLPRAKLLAEQARMRLAKCRSLSPLRSQLEQLAAAFARGEQYAQAQGGIAQIQPPAASPSLPRTPGPPVPSPAPAGASPSTDKGGPTLAAAPPAFPAAIEIWDQIPGQVSGVEMDIHVDGTQVGRVSNLDDRREVRLGNLATGFHSFSFVNMSAYLIDPAKGRTPMASGFACSGAFHFTGTKTVLRANVGTGPNGMMCTLQ
jgi:hypothetical protein